jgi:hypothetical protein
MTRIKKTNSCFAISDAITHITYQNDHIKQLNKIITNELKQLYHHLFDYQILQYLMNMKMMMKNKNDDLSSHPIHNMMAKINIFISY